MFVIYCSDSELTSSVTTYLASNPPARVTALFYSHGRKNVYAKDFPVNLLRSGDEAAYASLARAVHWTVS